MRMTTASMWPTRPPGLHRRFARFLRANGLRGASYVGRSVPIPEGPVIVPAEGGLWMLVEPSRQPFVDVELFVYGSYEPETLFVMSKLLHPGDGALDVGANIGLMTCFGAKLVGSTGCVVALEPSALSAPVLDANIELNGLTNVTVVKKGAGEQRAMVPLYHRPEVGSGGTTIRALPGRAPSESVEIDRIDDILAAIDHAAIRFVKIDVEGYELEAIRGAPLLLSRHPIVCMEYSRLVHQNSARIAADLLLEALDARAFIVCRARRRYILVELIGEDDYPQQDNVYFVPRSRLDEVRAAITVVAASR